MGQSEVIVRSREISAILFVIVRVASCEKGCKRVTPPLQGFLFVIVALQVARKIASCIMAFTSNDLTLKKINSRQILKYQ